MYRYILSLTFVYFVALKEIKHMQDMNEMTVENDKLRSDCAKQYSILRKIQAQEKRGLTLMKET